MKIISLFSGAGGLDLGLKQAGNDIVWANDIDPDAVATYRDNIGEDIVCADIKDIDVSRIPDAEVVVGGFPCQGFSLANMHRATSDERNTLYRFFLKVVREKKPRHFIAENVRGILSLGGGSAIEAIKSDFEKAGYRLSINLVNMADYGVPQTRQRVIILGNRHEEPCDLVLPAPTHSKDGLLPKWVSIKDAIGHFPDPDTANDISNHVYSKYKVAPRNFTGHRVTDPDKPCPTILARGNGGGGVVAIPHYNGRRRLTIRESAAIQTFPDDFAFHGRMNSCYRQIGNAVPVRFARMLGEQLVTLEQKRRLVR